MFFNTLTCPSCFLHINKATFTFQLFVLCWVDESRDRSTLQVIYAASVPGSHSAAQIQPLDGGSRADFSVFTFFVPQEGVLNTESRHGFVAHKNQQVCEKLRGCCLYVLKYLNASVSLQTFAFITFLLNPNSYPKKKLKLEEFK